MRIVHSGRHPQQGGRRTHRQRQGGEPGPYEEQPDGHRDRQGRVVAGEGPVARLGTRHLRPDPGQGAAGTFLVDEELDGLTGRIGEGGPGGGRRGPGQAAGVPAAQGAPGRPEQQQPEQQQGALTGRLQQGPRPRRAVGDAPGQRPVTGGRPAPGDVHRRVRAHCSSGGQPHHGRRSRTGRGDREQRAAPPAPSHDRIHAPTVGTARPAHPGRTAARTPDDRRG